MSRGKPRGYELKPPVVGVEDDQAVLVSRGKPRGYELKQHQGKGAPRFRKRGGLGGNPGAMS